MASRIPGLTEVGPAVPGHDEIVALAPGKLHGWYAFGDADAYLLIELPDDIAAASTVIKAASSGAFASLSTTKLLTVEETLEALGRGGGIGYRAPGASRS